jgi:hypothetical protein
MPLKKICSVLMFFFCLTSTEECLGQCFNLNFDQCISYDSTINISIPGATGILWTIDPPSSTPIGPNYVSGSSNDVTFDEYGISCYPIGRVTAKSSVTLFREDEEAVLWDFDKEPFIGFSPSSDIQIHDFHEDQLN